MRGQGGQATIEYQGLLVLLAVLLGTLAVIGVPAAATFARRALATRPATEDQRAAVERLRTGSLAAFLTARADPARDPRLDWSTDGCSAPVTGDRGAFFDFSEACLRHDFGYRNTKRLGTFAHDRAQIDARFLKDMQQSCHARALLLRAPCLRWAYVYYAGVRAFGGV